MSYPPTLPGCGKVYSLCSLSTTQIFAGAQKTEAASVLDLRIGPDLIVIVHDFLSSCIGCVYALLVLWFVVCVHGELFFVGLFPSNFSPKWFFCAGFFPWGIWGGSP